MCNCHFTTTPNMETISPKFDPYVSLQPSFYTKKEADDILAYLQTLDYEKTSYYMYGKLSHSPRQMKWVSDNISIPYVFSQTHVEGLTPVPFTPELNKIKEKVEKTTGQSFNALLINKYESGQDKISWHSDNDAWCGSNFIVPSLSFGAERKFYLRNKTNKSEQLKLVLKHGSLVSMKEDCQDKLEHSIPVEAKVLNTRFNLTFRNIIYPDKARSASQSWDKIKQKRGVEFVSAFRKRNKTSSKIYSDFHFN